MGTLRDFYYGEFKEDVRRMPLKRDDVAQAWYFGNNAENPDFPWDSVAEDLSVVHPSSNECFVASLFSITVVDQCLHCNKSLHGDESSRQEYAKWEKAAIYPKFGHTTMGSAWSRIPFFILKCAEEKQLLDPARFAGLIPELLDLIRRELTEALEQFFHGDRDEATALLKKWASDFNFDTPKADCQSVRLLKSELKKFLATL